MQQEVVFKIRIWSGLPFSLLPFFPASLQSYTGSKPCVSCGSDMAHIKSSTYWEGGLGCRNKSKMSRYVFHFPHLITNMEVLPLHACQ